MKKLLLTLILLFNLCIESKAQTYVLIPDANFAAALQTIVPTAMSGNSLNITSTVVTNSITSLGVSNKSIANLDGVQYFTSLKGLSCTSNLLNSLPALPNTLITLFCGNNSITSIPAVPSLTLLNCYGNALTSLPSLNSVVYLDCSQNSLTSLPALPNATFVMCQTNSLTILPALSNSLFILFCYENSLTSLPVLPNSLRDLYCMSNNIKCFPVFPSSIQNINISPNPYNCLPNYVLPAMNGFTSTPLCQSGNSNGCDIVGIKELNPINVQISVFPNPFSSSFIIKIEEEISNLDLVIMNSLGQRVHEQKIVNGENSITIEKFSSGLYHYIILQNKQQFSRGKLIIE